MISIIIPVYNVKEIYFRQCLDSVINQTYQAIEVILIDDGSPNNSGEICDEYAEKDPRIRVIHQKNQGASVARNNGIYAAQGEWIMFVDADDWIEPDTCERIMSDALQLDIEVLYFSGYKECVSHQQAVSFPLKRDIVLSKEDKQILYSLFLELELPFSLGVPWGKLIMSSLLKRHNIKFLPGVVIAEDRIFNLNLAKCAARVAYTEKHLYHYRICATSVTGSSYTPGCDNYICHADEYLNQFILDNHLGTQMTEDLFNLWLCKSAKRIICNQYLHPKNKCSYRKKIELCDELVGKSLYSKAISEVNINSLSVKNKILVILLRKRQYFLLRCITNIWISLCGKKNYE